MVKTKQKTEKVKADKAEQAKAKQRKEALKKKIFDMEQTNNRYLIAYADGTGWYKLGGHSALIYHHRIAKRLKLRPRLNPDTDFYSRFKEGTVSIRQIETLENNLKTLKIYRNSKMTVPGEVYVFDLGYKVSDEDLDLMYRDEQIRRDNLNKMVLPKVVHPDIHATLLNTVKLCQPKVAHMPVVDREMCGYKIIRTLIRACDRFYLMSNGYISEEQGLKEVLTMVERVKVYIKVATELEIWPIESALMIATDLVKASRLIVKRLNEIKQKTRAAAKVTPVMGS